MEPRTKLYVAILTTLLVVGGLYWYLQLGYGETSQQGYAYSMALFSACNQRDPERLQLISDLIEQDRAAGNVNADEARWLQGIIRRGLSGDWQAANREVRRLMNDQVTQFSK